MRISLIYNTACMDKVVRERNNHYRQASYAEREELLSKALRGVTGFDEVIVAGTFKEGDGYRYVPVTPYVRDRRDALWQREWGARYSTGDILVFSHDDHELGEGFAETLREMLDEPWDLLVPQRRHSKTQEKLENGEAAGYMGGHALVMRRWLWAEVPWVSVDTEWWDVTMTRLWEEAGGRIVWTDRLVHYDIEAMENES